MTSVWSNIVFNAYISLLIFCLDDLSIDISGLLRSPYYFALLSPSHYISVNISFIFLGAPVLDTQMFTNFISSY